MTEENHEKLQPAYPVSRPSLSQAPPEYKCRALPLDRLVGYISVFQFYVVVPAEEQRYTTYLTKFLSRQTFIQVAELLSAQCSYYNFIN
jgi:hypothetical protein